MRWIFGRDGARELERSQRNAAHAAKKADEKRQKAAQRQHDQFMRARRAEELARQQAAGATHYTQIIMVLGYGGLFTLWIQLRGEMSDWFWAVTGTLITFSLLVFIGFELAKAYAQDAPRKPDAKMSLSARVAEWWRTCFLLAAGSGLLAGGSILIWFVYRAWLEALILMG